MISVIGGGPAGGFYASKEKHDDVHLFEEHNIIGCPVACTGILTDSVNQFITIPDRLRISTIERFKIIAPDGRSIYIDLNKKNHVLDRAKFDQYLAESAVDNGAQLHIGERVVGYKKTKTGFVIKTTKKTYETSMIVGTDG